jgi:hypothetical protein
MNNRQITGFILILLMGAGFVLSGQENRLSAGRLEQSTGDHQAFGLTTAQGLHRDVLVGGSLSGIMHLGDLAIRGGDQNSAFLARRDSLGQWSLLLEATGSGFSHINVMTISGEEVLFAGVFSREMQVGPSNLAANRYQSVFVGKVNLSGTVSWLRQLDMIPAGEKQHMVVQDDGSFLLATGFFGDFQWNGARLSTSFHKQILLLKFSPEGEILNASRIGGEGSCTPVGLHTLPGGGIVLAGDFSGKHPFETGEEAAEVRKGFFAAGLNDRLETDWSLVSTGAGEGSLTGMAVSESAIWLAGEYSGELDLGQQQLPGASDRSMFIAQLNPEGEVLIALNHRGQSWQKLQGIAAGSDGQLYLLGTWRGRMEAADKHVDSRELTRENFLAKYTESGELAWIIPAGNHAITNAFPKTNGEDGVIHITGFNSVPDQSLFGTEMEEQPGLFIMELFDCDYGKKLTLASDTTLCGPGSIDLPEGFTVLSWSGSGDLQNSLIPETGDYLLTASDERGCVSSAGIHVTVLPPFEIEILGEQWICPGQPGILRVDTPAAVSWNTGAAGKELVISEPGLYSAVAVNSDGCEAFAGVMVGMHEVIQPELEEQYFLPKHESLRIYPGSYAAYDWGNGFTGPELLLKGEDLPEGQHFFNLKVSDFNGCALADSFMVQVVDLEKYSMCDFDMYPNPARRVFEISSTVLFFGDEVGHTPANAEIIVYSPRGAPVYREKIYAYPFTVTVNPSRQLSSGIYLVTLQIDGSFCRMKKLIVLP